MRIVTAQIFNAYNYYFAMVWKRTNNFINDRHRHTQLGSCKSNYHKNRDHDVPNL
jgi:hypothetical protein